MSKFIIQGGKKLKGEIKIAGAKNQALKLVAACVLTDEDVILNNIPMIADIKKMLLVIQSAGAKVEALGENKIKINCSNFNPEKIDQKLVKQFRASFILSGAILARYKKAELAFPGGCNLGARPVNTHLLALEDLGVECNFNETTEMFNFVHDGLKNNPNLILKEFSVTATENTILAACFTEGETRIKKAACEPHINGLMDFLNQMGANIKWDGNHVIKIEGVKKLHGTEYTVISDMIEAGTFICLAGVTKSKIKLINVDPEHLDDFLDKMKDFGMKFEITADSILVLPPSSLHAIPIIKTGIYPGFPTDLQQPTTVLATQAQGITTVFETMFDGRFGYTHYLNQMNADIVRKSNNVILVTGPTPLYGAEVEAVDLRAGATLVIAGLLARGKTIIDRAEVIDRGYENIVERLQSIGADIHREE